MAHERPTFLNIRSLAVYSCLLRCNLLCRRPRPSSAVSASRDCVLPSQHPCGSGIDYVYLAADKRGRLRRSSRCLVILDVRCRADLRMRCYGDWFVRHSATCLMTCVSSHHNQRVSTDQLLTLPIQSANIVQRLSAILIKQVFIPKTFLNGTHGSTSIRCISILRCHQRIFMKADIVHDTYMCHALDLLS